MNKQWEQRFMEDLEATIGELTNENELNIKAGFPALHSGFKLFDDAEIVVMIESFLTELSPELVIFDVFMTIASGMPDELAAELIKVCNALNYYANFGSFGIHDDGNILFFKHANTIEINKDNETLIEEVMVQYTIMLNILRNNYGLFDKVTRGEITADELIANGVVE